MNRKEVTIQNSPTLVLTQFCIWLSLRKENGTFKWGVAQKPETRSGDDHYRIQTKKKIKKKEKKRATQIYNKPLDLIHETCKMLKRKEKSTQPYGSQHRSTWASWGSSSPQLAQSQIALTNLAWLDPIYKTHTSQKNCPGMHRPIALVWWCWRRAPATTATQ